MKVKRHLTAIRRNKPSLPLVKALEKGFIKDKRSSVLDYGCGRGDDIEYLQNNNYKNVHGYDPYFKTDEEPLKQTSYSILNYVLCVIEDPDEREFVLKRVWALTNKRMLISIRPPDFKLMMKYRSTGDNEFEVYTSRGTYQKFWTPSEFRNFIDLTLGPNIPIEKITDYIYILG